MKTAPQLSVRAYGAAPGGHQHDHFQVIWPLAGCLELEVEGRGVALQVGDALIVRPGDRHDFESRMGSRCLVLDTHDPQWQHRSDRPQFARSASQMAAFVAVALEDQPALALASGAEWLAQCWGAPDALLRPRRHIDWKAMGEWAQNHLHQKLNAADLAALAALSESQFRARCVAETGLAPMQWLRRQRLLRAQALRRSGLKLADVAQQVGYESAPALASALARMRAA